MQDEPSSLYICSTLFHVYVATQKVIVSGEGAAIWLDTSIPGYDALSQRLRESCVFRSVQVIQREQALYSDMRHIIPRRVLSRLSVRELDAILGTAGSVDRVYVFNDTDWFGWYLNDRKIYYHLLEDGMDCFKYFDQNASMMERGLLKRATIAIFGVTYTMAQSKYCIDVELNDSKDLATHIDKPVIELQKTELRERTIRVGAQPLFKVFPIPDADSLMDGVLILTLPSDRNGKGEVITEKYLPGHMSQTEFCKKAIEKFPGHQCFIKPHPRDTTDYRGVLSNEFIIPREIPAEMFSYVDGLHMYAAVTIISTALAAIDFVEKKYALSAELTKSGEFLPLDI